LNTFLPRRVVSQPRHRAFAGSGTYTEIGGLQSGVHGDGPLAEKIREQSRQGICHWHPAVNSDVLLTTNQSASLAARDKVKPGSCYMKPKQRRYSSDRSGRVVTGFYCADAGKL